MSLSIPNTAATANFVSWGGGSLYKRGGYLFIGNGAVDVQLTKGTNTGIEFEDGPFTLAAGYYPLDPVDADGICIIAIKIRAQAGVLTNPVQQYYGALFDAGPGIAAGIPFTGVLSPSGGVTPPPPATPTVITGQVDHQGNILGGTGFTVIWGGAGTGLYTIVFATAYATIPAVVFWPIEDVTAAAVGIIRSNSVSQVSLLMYSPASGLGTPVDQGFNFLATAMV